MKTAGRKKLVKKASLLAVFSLLIFSFLSADLPPNATGKITFYTKNNLIKVDGEVKDFTIETIAFDKDPQNLRMKARLNMKSVTEPNKKLTRSLQREEFFHTEAFQYCDVSIDSIKRVGKKRFLAYTNVSMKGTSRQVPLSFMVIKKSRKGMNVSGQGKVYRHDFNIGKPDKKYHALNDSVLVKFELTIPSI